MDGTPTSYSQAQSSNPWPGTSYLKLSLYIYLFGGQGSSVGIATPYGLDDPVIEYRWGGGREFPQPSRPASYTLDTGYFPGVKRPGRGVDPPPPSSAEVEGWAIPLLPHLFWGDL